MPYRPDRPSVRGFLAFLIVTPLVVLTVPLILLVAAVLKLLGRDKLNVGPEYVEDYLQLFIAGEEGDWDWDDFCSTPLKDERLAAIQEQACRFAPPGALTDDEREELQRLLIEVRSA